MNFLDRKKMNLPTTNVADLFEDYGNAATARSIEGKLMRFSKGDYSTGQEAEEIPLGKRFIARMDMFKLGYVYWQNNLPVEEWMGLLAEGFVPPKRSELGNLDKALWERDSKGQPRDPCQYTNHLILDEAESGELYTFATNSRGGTSAMGELCKTYGKHIREHPDEDPVIDRPEDIEAFLRKWDRPDRAAYFCTATVQAGAMTRSKATLAELNGLHIDIDFKSITISAEEAERKLQQLMLLPSKVVASGGGLHAYWLFKEALPATPENIERVEGLLQLLADHLGGDPACAEASRLMRLPGSHNTKDGRLDRSPDHHRPAAALRDRRAYRMAGGGVTGNLSGGRRRQWRQRRRFR